MKDLFLAYPIFVIILRLFLLARAECPRKYQEVKNVDDYPDDDDSKTGQKHGEPPGLQPLKHFVQTTFIFRDLTEDDRLFSHIVMEKMHQLRPRLKANAQLIIDNENIDCAQQHFQRCREYPLKTSYHFLVVEDSVHGAAVYSIDRALNKNNQNAVEMALLDSLSRHSLYSLMGYASKEVGKELGFIREVRQAELEMFGEENQKEMALRSKSSASSIFTRSPFEIQLLNERIIEMRRHDFQYASSPRTLKQFQGGELAEAIESGQIVFVLFWTNVASVSSHTFELWGRVADAWSRLEQEGKEKVLAGSVACHEEIDVCTAFAISHQSQHTVFVYKDGRLAASQISVGDERFYLEWMKMIIGGQLIRVNEEELQKAKSGLVSGFSEDVPRPVVTIGMFATEDSEEFKRFNKTAKMLNGRYHLLYAIDEKSAATISTVRPLELVQKTIEYVGNFDSKSLLSHITHASLPSVFDIGRGFTTELFFHTSPRPIVLLLFSSDRDADVLQAFQKTAGESVLHNKAREKLFAQIDRSTSVKLEKFLEQIRISVEDLPALCVFQQDVVKCTKNIRSDVDVGEYIDKEERLSDTVPIASNTAHPLKYIQLQRINEIFGEQPIELLAEPRLVGHNHNSPFDHHNPHDFEDMDEASVSGCPMMAHMERTEKDEL